MRVIVLVVLAMVLVTYQATAQVKIYEDNFNGGVTGAGYSPGTTGLTPGMFSVSIEPGSTIRQAYLLASRHGVAPAKTVQLNGMPFTFDASNQVSPTFTSPLYGGPSGVHAIDVTAFIDPLVSAYTLDVPLAGGVNDRFADYYLYIAYDNPSLNAVSTALYVNDQDLSGLFLYNLDVTTPIGSCGDVGLAIFAGYVCNTAGDGELVGIEGTFVGEIGGPDFNSGGCGGPMGNFFYFNGSLTGLGDDIANNFVAGPDALCEISPYITPGPSVAVAFQHDPSGSLNDNAIWALMLVYGSDDSTMLVDAGADTSICQGQSIQLSGSGSGVLSWSPSTSLSDPLVSNPVANPDSTTTYVLTSTGICGSLTDSVTVEVGGLNLSALTGDSICIGGSVVIGPVAVPDFTYSWSPSDGLSDPGIANPLASPSITTNYTLIVSDASGCADSVSALIIVNEAMVEAGPDQSILPGGTALISATGTGTFSWSPPDFLSCTLCSDPAANPPASTTYSVLLTSTEGCQASDSVTVWILEQCGQQVFYPNAFTPNGDGINDDFGPVVTNLDLYSVHIYNRWGEVVFQSLDPDQRWDGTNANGQEAELGTYIYVAELRCPGGDKKVFKGTVTLLR